jgi:hypothetical protein
VLYIVGTRQAKTVEPCGSWSTTARCFTGERNGLQWASRQSYVSIFGHLKKRTKNNDGDIFTKNLSVVNYTTETCHHKMLSRKYHQGGIICTTSRYFLRGSNRPPPWCRPNTTRIEHGCVWWGTAAEESLYSSIPEARWYKRCCRESRLWVLLTMKLNGPSGCQMRLAVRRLDYDVRPQEKRRRKKTSLAIDYYASVGNRYYFRD